MKVGYYLKQIKYNGNIKKKHVNWKTYFHSCTNNNIRFFISIILSDHNNIWNCTVDAFFLYKYIIICWLRNHSCFPLLFFHHSTDYRCLLTHLFCYVIVEEMTLIISLYHNRYDDYHIISCGCVIYYVKKKLIFWSAVSVCHVLKSKSPLYYYYYYNPNNSDQN